MQIKLDLEIWHPIPGLEGRYDVSNCGRVRSLLTDRVLATARNPHGYEHIPLRVAAGVKKSFDIHRLVMLAFIGPSDLTVNHINGIKWDNRLENLEYATRSENQQHALKVLEFQPRFGERHPHAKLKTADIVAIRTRAIVGDTLVSISNDYGKSTGTICDIVSGKSWRHAPGPIRSIQR